MLDSALTITQDSLPWGLVRAATGTLVPVNATDMFEWGLYARRDKELAYRDHIVAGGLAQVAVEIATIWGTAGPRPKVQAVVQGLLAIVGCQGYVSPSGTVAHMTPLSVPFDASNVDVELYERDVVVLEAVARATQVLVDPPISRVDPSSTIITGGTISQAWSLAEGTLSEVDISPALQLDTAYFKVPDMNLAARDNTLARYAAEIQHVLRNPFESATRLLVEVTSQGTREAEVYTLVADSATAKVFQAEPAFPGRLNVLYDRQLKTLQWTTEDPLVVHTPQPQPYASGQVAMSGPAAGQQLQLVPAVPARHDCQFWRQKATKLSFANHADVSIFSSFSLASLLVPAASGVSMASFDQVVQPQPTVTRLQLLGAQLASGATYRVAVLFRPMAELVIPGGPGAGLDYSTTGGVGLWSFTLPAGHWQLRVHYTSVVGEPPPEFMVTVLVAGQPAQNLALRFGLDNLVNGDEGVAGFQVQATGGQQVITVTWTPPAGNLTQLRITKLRLVSTSTTPVTLDLQAELWSATSQLGVASAALKGRRYRPDVVSFIFAVQADAVDPYLDLRWAISTPQDCVLAFVGVEVLKVNVVQPLANVAGFEPAKDEFLRRAHEAVLDAYAAAYAISPGVEFRDLVNGHPVGWSQAASVRWMAFIKGSEPRVDQAFRPSRPGDVSRTALLPAGLELDFSGGTVAIGEVLAHYPAVRSLPMLCSLQPWMISVGVHVAHEDFWINDVLPDS